MNTVPNEQIAPEIVQAIIAQAAASGLSVNVDSRVPDPSSPQRPTLFGQLLTEEFRKQGLKFS